ncbi:hypothetical protein SAMN00777080_1455 [Aquiflexum balticum DSM 16537]|uniref:SIR2-like domain-containing protein n=1 Tax=Aquiflexum balticum DSM 16537 TaxID=758820 RepID=A0A1W2H2P1_9BACT|nr:hypothetical protein [Aquiflexum balticum]SMD42888.1 hypothetical protein SAMN00777080_1455 [Aquiflexum balticum DSM 16537]
MGRIIYLLGAGASINCIPIVEKLSEGFKIIAERLSDEFNIPWPEILEDSKSLIKKRNELKSDMIWLSEISNNRASIDTVAKSYFLKEDFESVKRLKIALSTYILLQQLYTPLDKRYDLFLASIFKKSMSEIPKEIKILSWNYDNQLELAFNIFSQHPGNLQNRDFLKILDKYSETKDLKNNAFVYKINGSAGMSFEKKLGLERVPNDFNLPRIIEGHEREKSNLNLEPGISFAWENPQISEKKLHNILRDCEILVTIGYSFPFFNRDIDKTIFEKAIYLKKIYIQNPRASEIEEKLKNLINPNRKIKFVQDTSTNEFMIPYEL